MRLNNVMLLLYLENALVPVQLHMYFNPLKCSGMRWLHLKVVNANQA